MTTAAPWQIREVTAQDLPVIRELYAAVRGGSRPASYDQWRYFSSPDGIIPAALAMDGDRAAGFYTVWPVRLRIGSDVVLGGQSMDTMTHPAYQGQGVFVKLALACFEIATARGLEVLYGFPNPLSYPGFVRRLNWDHTGDVPHWIRPLRLSRYHRIPAWLGPLSDAVSATWPIGSSGMEVVPAAPSASDIDRLLASWCPEKELCRIERSAIWFAWRYAAEAENDYRWFTALKGGQPVATGVWGMQNKSWPARDGRAHIVELFGNEEGCRAVLAAIIRNAWQQGAWLIETVSNVPSIVSALRRAGFIRHRMAPLIVRGLTRRNLAANIHTHSQWRLSGGDIDTF